VVILSTFVTNILSQFEEPEEKRFQCLNDNRFDFLLLSLQWLTSFCWQKQKCNENNRENRWQIHGLWPQLRNGLWPQYCCSDTNYNTRNIEPLLGELVESWKSLKIDGNHESFWRHEWTKHGTCATSSPLLKGQFEYFSKALQVFNSFPLKSWLSKGGIIASNDRFYSIHHIHEAIEFKLKSRVRLECALIPHSLPLLTEIQICLDKNSLHAIDCPHKDDHQCGRKDVIFPSN